MDVSSLYTTAPCLACGGTVFVAEWPEESDDGRTVWSHNDPRCDDPSPDVHTFYDQARVS
jgi:hypothetical protein